ncbi:FtsK/SpoIIIE domain-containing protein [Mycobacterium sp. 48b]|uniref:FtsK/SpoIIIE domain-containing protein n=1 Tax=Mycobacterium sp. 48b TaxID=3400426 RepID=UPI003AAD0A0A
MTSQRKRDESERLPGFLDLHGLDGPTFDVAAGWAAQDVRGGDLSVPIGFDASGAVVALDFSRWTGLDDHVLVVGSTGAGTTTLLRTLALSLCVTQHPSHAGFFVVEGKADIQEYAELGSKVPHCRGHVTFSDDRREWTVHRLTQALVGEVDRRERFLQSMGMASIEGYRNVLRVNPVDDPDRADVPEALVLIDNLSWLHGESFDKAIRLLAAQGHRLGLRMVVSVPYLLWESLKSTGYFDSFTARVALGLGRRQASAVLGTDVADDLGSPGDAYVSWLGAQPIRVRIATADTPVAETS